MRAITFTVLALTACSRSRSPGASRSDASALPVPTASSATLGADACNGPRCRRYPSAAAAFLAVLAENPTILAVGESHAQKGSGAIASSAKHFTEELLPIAAPKSSDIVVELWAPDPHCQKAVAAVAGAQQPAVAAQAETNQNEYLTLGMTAKALEMTPWLLRPTCQDFADIADAGDDAVGPMLFLVKRLTQQKLAALWQKNARAPITKMVLAYGGAMHNDLLPAIDLAAYAFGKDLAALTPDYVELDLVVPEFVKDTGPWRSLPWYAAFKADSRPRDRATLYRPGDHSFVIVFPPSI